MPAQGGLVGVRVTEKDVAIFGKRDKPRIHAIRPKSWEHPTDLHTVALGSNITAHYLAVGGRWWQMTVVDHAITSVNGPRYDETSNLCGPTSHPGIRTIGSDGSGQARPDKVRSGQEQAKQYSINSPQYLQYSKHPTSTKTQTQIQSTTDSDYADR
ncbi:hypothetical protein SNK03_006078 [Fusarium graminearum]|uniref:Chromosome 2, complete genome n=1 Tax=Gibberella zeae (strain ATCC MYA-4620 / CBS 123657 / FGSC 9075 / NRRL 31084 / PH-1) TaxID=229533 RepID=I1S6G6_GIBZE|nr:hypothetical protein FGSG_12437 [Fusarium graminearum PH-1]ESU09803.1 hypothetical protein FGSG_12437 [Fusarium graminearum PH-1]CEF78222.1 unnamed protein product [Fusarium graminearum]CZS81518.1 unnamed protein product [Fusarium graminearum]|eukprot:XP_011322302.1 hypothetical protein FGSG_12437 [Fusarium graminearum PH-1]